jgi:hypothetical protein
MSLLGTTLVPTESTVPLNYLSTNWPLSLGGVSAGEPFGGASGEVFLFNRALDDTEQTAVLAHLRSKWHLP